MHAIEMLKKQHREAETLFQEIEEAREAEQKQALFLELADALAAHMTIEERHFYPNVREEHTEELLLESLEEHLAAKRVLADLLQLEAGDPTFEAKLKVLQEQIEHHVQEEEEELFPSVARVIEEAKLEAIAREMQQTMGELEQEEARYGLLEQTEAAAPLD
jgi:hypothetical protein